MSKKEAVKQSNVAELKRKKMKSPKVKTVVNPNAAMLTTKFGKFWVNILFFENAESDLELEVSVQLRKKHLEGKRINGTITCAEINPTDLAVHCFSVPSEETKVKSCKRVQKKI